MFTSATIITSAILFQGFKGTGIQIATVIIGFMQICAGVVLLQLSKSAKDVPDAAIFKGDLDQIREVAEVEEPESEPKADSIRGAASIIRRISTARRTMESDEARRGACHGCPLMSMRTITDLAPSKAAILSWITFGLGLPASFILLSGRP